MTRFELTNNAAWDYDFRLLIATLLSFVYIFAIEDPSLENQNSRGVSVGRRRLAAHKRTGIMNAWAGICYEQDAGMHRTGRLARLFEQLAAACTLTVCCASLLGSFFRKHIV